MRQVVFVVVLVSGIFLVLRMGMSGQSSPSSSNSPLSRRYQIVFNPNVRADTFLLDTETGKIWRRAMFSDLPDQPTAWEFENRIDKGQELREYIKAMGGHSGG